jgi:pimeloyl-ACP methyl ester carboxylesterase
MVLAYQAPDYREGAIPANYRPELVARLPEIAAPSLVVVGEHDVPDFRLIAEILAANIPRARLRVMPGCWHLPPLEDPDSFNNILISFLRECGDPVLATR